MGKSLRRTLYITAATPIRPVQMLPRVEAVRRPAHTDSRCETTSVSQQSIVLQQQPPSNRYSERYLHTAEL